MCGISYSATLEEGTGRRYGTAHSVKTLAAAVEGIQYPGVKLPG